MTKSTTIRTLSIAGLAFAISLGIIAAPVHAETELPANVPQPPPLDWQPCPDAPDRDCAALIVPLDYADPSKGTIDVSVARAPATDPANRIGALVYNPGGPGVPVSGFIQFGNLSSQFTEEMQERFDIVGFDPRGTEQTITCLPDSQAQAEYWESNHLARTMGEVNQISGLNGQANQNCLNLNKPIARHLDTASVVRDMESLRLAMGTSEFNYMGNSYGTFIGYRYAHLYPGNLRSMVLDAITDRSISDAAHIVESSRAYDKGWQQFKEWCHADQSCALNGENIDDVFDHVLAGARTQPIPAPDSPITTRPVNDWILTTMVQALVAPGEVTYEWVETMIDKGRNGDASLARLIYDSATGTINETTYFPDANQRRAITCVDTRWSEMLTVPTSIKALAALTDVIAPRFGEANIWQGPAQCYDYPVEPTETPPLDSDVADDFPVLVIGGTRDRSTPYSWSERITGQIDGARLLTREGDGHISFNKSRCVQDYVENYVLALDLPPAEAVCQTDPDLYPVEPVPQLPLNQTLSLGQSDLPEVVLESVSQILD